MIRAVLESSCLESQTGKPMANLRWQSQQLLMPREKAPVVHFLISNVEPISCIWQNMHDSMDRHKLDKAIMGNLGYIFNLKVWDFPQATLWFQQTLQGPCKHVLYVTEKLRRVFPAADFLPTKLWWMPKILNVCHQKLPCKHQPDWQLI